MRNAMKAAVVGAVSAGFALAGAGAASASANSSGLASNSPGVLSGNLLQVPVHVPLNVCGNTINVIGVLNPAFGNTCGNLG